MDKKMNKTELASYFLESTFHSYPENPCQGLLLTLVMEVMTNTTRFYFHHENLGQLFVAVNTDVFTNKIENVLILYMGDKEPQHHIYKPNQNKLARKVCQKLQSFMDKEYKNRFVKKISVTLESAKILSDSAILNFNYPCMKTDVNYIPFVNIESLSIELANTDISKIKKHQKVSDKLVSDILEKAQSDFAHCSKFLNLNNYALIPNRKRKVLFKEIKTDILGFINKTYI